jgi:hypothetical protein
MWSLVSPVKYTLYTLRNKTILRSSIPIVALRSLPGRAVPGKRKA